MLRLTYDIRINGRRLNRLLSCALSKSAEELTDRATLKVNAMAAGQALQTEEAIHAGLPIRIALGYDGDNRRELEGYIVSTSNNDGLLTIQCEDAMYLLRQEVQNQQLTNVSATEIAEAVVAEAGQGLSVEAGAGVSDIRFSEFTIVDATAWDVLNKLRTQGGLLIYARGKKVYLSLRYLQDAAARGKVRYDFAKNVQKSRLKYIRAEERKVLVKVIGITKDNQRILATAGAPGQDSFTFTRFGVADEAAAQRIAEEEFKKWSYTGYEGSLTSWLVPYATYGMQAELIDPLYPAREGIYYISAVRVSYSADGGRREVFLAQKVA